MRPYSITTLIELIHQAESMDKTEREFWLEIMPTLAQPKRERLFEIIELERVKLQECEAKFQRIFNPTILQWDHGFYEYKKQYISTI